MELLAALDLSAAVDVIVNILIVAIGLGFVIFFHELGHFAVAKWCDVNVERFSIGFGPILWSFKRGETEYALSVVPFGGYVKMLGQDDLDPNQMSSDAVALDPRSYSAKRVGQRMAIISAGVIMNVITGLLFFAVAFQLGVETSPAVIGHVHVGMPAWEVGLQDGDRITRINGREATSFADIMRGVALTTGPVTLEGLRPDNTTFELQTIPNTSGTRRMIGVGPTPSLTLIDLPDEKIPFAAPGSPASAAVPAFQAGDVVLAVGGQTVHSHAEFEQILAEKRSSALEFQVRRKGSHELVTTTVEPCRFRELGLTMDIERVANIQAFLPAQQAGFRVGDKIVKVGGKEIGAQMDPLSLPDYFADHHGEIVDVVVTREEETGTKQEVLLHVKPIHRAGWLERPTVEGTPLSIPAIGIAYHVTSQVLKVREGSPAAQAGIQPGERVTKLELVLPKGQPDDGLAVKPIELGGDSKNWVFAFWTMQVAETRHVILQVSNSGKQRQVELTPQWNDSWYVPRRGLRFEGLAVMQKADHFGAAMAMGMAHTKNSMLDIYLTLRNLIGGFLSVKELHGPIGIAKVAYEVTKRGLPELLLFLGFLSINLAVLNFLPIPVLDGGHMIFLCWEAVTRERPSERVLVAATYCGMAFILGLMLLVIYLDIFVHQLGFD